MPKFSGDCARGAEDVTQMRTEYDFDSPGAIRGKYYKRLLKEGAFIAIRGSGNVFLDLGFDKAKAENLRLRSQLMRHIDDAHRKSGATVRAGAKRLGLTPPQLDALLKGKISQFSLDVLVRVASRAGLQVRLAIEKAASAIPAESPLPSPASARAPSRRG
jgi:predicted XRE-type DNA-binding protein